MRKYNFFRILSETEVTGVRNAMCCLSAYVYFMTCVIITTNFSILGESGNWKAKYTCRWSAIESKNEVMAIDFLAVLEVQ